MRVELTMADLQSAALATWLRRLIEMCYSVSLRQTLPVGQVARFALPLLRRAVLKDYRDCIGQSITAD